MILVADDEAHIRHLLRFVLGRAGYQVTAVEGGLEALEVLRRDPVELLILDLMMKDLDGFGVLEALGQARPPVLVLTASGEERHEQRARALGAAAFLTKPFAGQDLLNAVRETSRALGVACAAG